MTRENEEGGKRRTIRKRQGSYRLINRCSRTCSKEEAMWQQDSATRRQHNRRVYTSLPGDHTTEGQPNHKWFWRVGRSYLAPRKETTLALVGIVGLCHLLTPQQAVTRGSCAGKQGRNTYMSAPQKSPERQSDKNGKLHNLVYNIFVIHLFKFIWDKVSYCLVHICMHFWRIKRDVVFYITCWVS
jgi:hypothetical protein